MKMQIKKIMVGRMLRLLIQITVTVIVVWFTLFNYLGGINPLSAFRRWYLGEVGWLIEQSANSRERQDTGTAVDFANAAVQLDPNSPEALQEQTNALASDGNPFGAMRSLNRLIEIDPADVQGYFDRSTLLYNEGKIKESIAELGNALAIQPDNVDALLARAGIYIEQHDWDAAIADYNRVIEINPDSTSRYGFINAYTGRAVAFLNKKMIREAIPDFQSGLDFNPDAMYHRGKLPKLKKALTTLDPASDEYRQLEELIARIKAL